MIFPGLDCAVFYVPSNFCTRDTKWTNSRCISLQQKFVTLKNIVTQSFYFRKSTFTNTMSSILESFLSHTVNCDWSVRNVWSSFLLFWIDFDFCNVVLFIFPDHLHFPGFSWLLKIPRLSLTVGTMVFAGKMYSTICAEWSNDYFSVGLM